MAPLSTPKELTPDLIAQAHADLALQGEKTLKPGARHDAVLMASRYFLLRLGQWMSDIELFEQIRQTFKLASGEASNRDRRTILDALPFLEHRRGTAPARHLSPDAVAGFRTAHQPDAVFVAACNLERRGTGMAPLFDAARLGRSYAVPKDVFDLPIFQAASTTSPPRRRSAQSKSAPLALPDTSLSTPPVTIPRPVNDAPTFTLTPAAAMLRNTLAGAVFVKETKPLRDITERLDTAARVRFLTARRRHTHPVIMRRVNPKDGTLVGLYVFNESDLSPAQTPSK